MGAVDLAVLPYRTDARELLRWVERRARGRSAAQLRDMGSSPKVLEGTAVAAEAFGYWRRDDDRLTPAGERLALAPDGERDALLRDAVLAYEPYRRLLRAVAERREREVTEVQWIETWWATHGYGSSQSNRMEGTAVLGRLAEQLDLGRYIPGRRGHPTRIEWRGDVLDAAAEPSGGARPAPVGAPEGPAARPAGEPEWSDPGPPPRPPAAPAPVGGAAYNEVTVPLEGGAEARLVVPHRLSAAEKRRLLSLLDLLIREE